MKELKDVICCVVDYGKFILLADKLSETYKKTYYYSPTEREFEDINDCVKADGLKHLERIDSFLEPEVFDEIDLFVFPDIGYAGTQRFLRRQGKAVWGAMGVGDLELSRTEFLDFLDEVKLPKVKSVKIKGLTALTTYLQHNKCKWIKINRFRACMETWYHSDFKHSQQKLDSFAVRFGGLKERVMFVVQDELESDVEIGYDGWTVDGQFPTKSFQGYELKNELYLGSLLTYDKLPKQVRQVNEAMVPLLKKKQYRNFLATELRVKDEVPYFIDPTFRMAGLTEDQLPETCLNLAEVVWAGANGVVVQPKYIANFVAVATMHYKGHVKHQWFQLDIPEEVRKWCKLYHYCIHEGMYHFIPSIPFECDEAGVVIGVGSTIEESIERLKKNFSVLKCEPLDIDVTGFAELIKQVKAAEKEGMKFSSKPVPPPTVVLR